MEGRCRDLHRSSKGEALSLLGILRIELERPGQHTGGHKVLLLAIVCTAIEIRRIVFDFDPRLFREMKLSIRIPGERAAQFVSLLRGDQRTEAGGDVEFTEAFARSQSGRNGRMGSAVLVVPVGTVALMKALTT